MSIVILEDMKESLKEKQHFIFSSLISIVMVIGSSCPYLFFLYLNTKNFVQITVMHDFYNSAGFFLSSFTVRKHINT